MKINKFIVSLIILSIGGTALIYGRLPDRIAMHFNYLGEVDRWGGRNSVWLTSSLPLLIYLLLYFVPRIDPRKDSYAKHEKGYSVLANGVVLFLISLNWFSIFYSMGFDLDIQVFILTAVGLLFILMGNHLPNARQNYTFGIRTPWTLADEKSWTKTHRIGGIAFVITGFIALISAWLPGLQAMVIFLVTVLLMIAGLTVYSYRIYRKSKP